MKEGIKGGQDRLGNMCHVPVKPFGSPALSGERAR